MQYYMLEYSFSGVKCIEKKITLSFYKQTINKNELNFQDYSVKAIYGENGVGKTAIASSIKILRDLILTGNYLQDSKNISLLRDLVNKRTESAYFRVKMMDIECKKIYQYSIRINYDEYDDSYVITEEKLDCGNKNIFTVVNGVCITDSVNYKYGSVITNLLNKRSVISVLVEYFYKNSISNVDSLESSVNSIYKFANSLYVYQDIQDDHDDFVYRNELYKGDKKPEVLSNLRRNRNTIKNEIRLDRENTISRDAYPTFVQYVNKLESFIRLFKKELKKIDIVQKEYIEGYKCSLKMNYGMYSVDTEYESTGIKKLLNLYKALELCYQGGIVFIDEFDSNLHDVYLCRIIEFISTFGNGQLCFTTHNLGPMDYLSTKKMAIDFLGANGEISSWKKNGNYVVRNLYRNGMIEGSLFDIEAYDFAGAFIDE